MIQPLEQKKSKFKVIPALIAAMLLNSSTAWADRLPGPAQAEQVRRTLSKLPSGQAKPLPKTTLPSEEAPPPLGEAALQTKFQLNQIVLSGNHIYSTQELLPLYQAQLHKEISIQELFAIEYKITNYYRNNGYILSRAVVTAQRIQNGIVHIQIIEGYIDEVAVSGDPKGAKSMVLEFGDQIAKKRPLQMSVMERYIFLANEIPGTEVKTVITPSKTKPGAADLDVITQHQLVTGYISYDNYGSQYIGPDQLTASMALNSLIRSGDATQLTVVKTPQSTQLTYFDLNYNTPVDAQGTRLLIGTTRSETQPGFVLEPAEINGVSSLYYTSLQQPLIRERSQTLTLHEGFNYQNNTTNSIAGELYQDHIRSLEVGGNYVLADRCAGVNTVKATFEQGLPILGYTSNTNPATAQTSNPGGHAVFSKVMLQASRLQTIEGPWSVSGLVSGQWANVSLLSPEQFTFGGSQLGRGYDGGELTGDRGISGTAELRYQFPRYLQLYTFYDIGLVNNIRTTPNTNIQQSASSTGAGVRFYLFKYVSGNLMWTQPLTHAVAAEKLAGNNTGNGYAPRVFFNITLTFY